MRQHREDVDGSCVYTGCGAGAPSLAPEERRARHAVRQALAAARRVGVGRRRSAEEEEAQLVDRIGQGHRAVRVCVRRLEAARRGAAEELIAEAADRIGDVEEAVVVDVAAEERGRKRPAELVSSRVAPGAERPLVAFDVAPDSAKKKRKRGKKLGAKGYGRKRYEELFTVEIIHDLPEGQKQCSCCGEAFLEFPGTEDSQEIHWEVHLVCRIHKRKRYVRTCSCNTLPGIVTAPCPPKLIPKGLFSIGFWVRLLLEKFLFQRPLYRVRKVLELEGLFVSQGTLTRGLKRLGELLQPLYTKILERSRAAKHWHMDETRWLVFVEVAGKVGHRWWLWVVITEDTCVYLLDPSRSADVPRNHLGEDAEGIISADRYSAYKVLEEEGHFRIAFCWFHVRQDFFRIHNEHSRLRAWAEGWLMGINDLFARNARRVQFPQGSKQFGLEDEELRKALAEMLKTCKRELANPALHRAAKKALVTLQNHWAGLLLFVDHPEIPMDNSESERRLRNPVVGRKNYYGSGSIWSGTLTAILFTLFQTLLLNHIDPQKQLTAYFEACARNGGEPPKDLEAFLPWNLSDERKAAWRYPPKHNAGAPQEKPP